jgi:hypothetical protein
MLRNRIAALESAVAVTAGDHRGIETRHEGSEGAPREARELRS